MNDLTKLIELQAAATPGPWDRDDGFIVTYENGANAEDEIIGSLDGDYTEGHNNRFVVAARNFDFAALDEKIKRYEEALRTVAEFGDEENEWDAVDKYKYVRGVASKALEQ